MGPRPASTWTPSPNFRPGRSQKVSCIVIHATETASLASPEAWLCDPKSHVSAHYLIDVDGSIFHLVHESDTAWDAGVSSYKGRPDVNAFSVGIELVNPSDGKTPYPEAQLAALCELVRAMAADYNVGPEDVVGHLDIAPGRKTDPAGFPWDDFRARLSA